VELDGSSRQDVWGTLEGQAIAFSWSSSSSAVGSAAGFLTTTPGMLCETPHSQALQTVSTLYSAFGTRCQFRLLLTRAFSSCNVRPWSLFQGQGNLPGVPKFLYFRLMHI
jgi:hypothetical protein